MRMEVASLPDELAHEGIAVLNKDDLENLGISSGSAITIRAGRLGRAIARTSQDADPGFVYLDATSRLNCSCRIGDSIEIEAIENPRELKAVLLAPVGEEIDEDLEDSVVGNSQVDSCRGDHITIPSPEGGILEMQVERLRPFGTRISGGLVSPETELTIAQRPARKPLLETGDVSFADIGGLDSVIEKLQEVAVVPLLHPEVFIRG